MSMPGAIDAGQVAIIATEVFAAMIDREAGFLTTWSGGPLTVADPLYAWVDLSTVPASRLQLSTDAGTADEVTRAFLTMGRVEPVAEADVADALGEIANVLAGNVKALLPEHVEMRLPKVSWQSPWRDGARLNEVLLEWRGRPIVVSLGTI
jgi:chemotaxis protein CheX